MAARRPSKASEAAPGETAPKSLAGLNRIIRASAPLVEGGSARAVLGEGPLHPEIALVGEQPGDQEDMEGRPFVGPAGRLLHCAMEEAGIDRSEAYLTNAVKHFKFVQRGKRRIHAKPTIGEIKRYRWWLQKELEFVQPDLVVALGASAIVGLAGRSMPVNANRGPADLGGWRGYVTVHPSSLLRQPDENARRIAYRAFVQDLARARKIAAGL